MNFIVGRNVLGCCQRYDNNNIYSFDKKNIDRVANKVSASVFNSVAMLNE